MLITIEWTLRDLQAVSRSLGEEAGRRLEQFLHSLAASSHIVGAAPTTDAAFRTVYGKEFCERALRPLTQDWIDIARIAELASHRAELSPTAQAEARITVESRTSPRECTVYGVPLQHARSLTSSRPILLAENQTDASFIHAAAVEWLAAHQVREKFRLENTTEGGGGSTIGAEVRSRFASRSVFVCVADSDRKHAAGRMGETARDARRAFSEGLPQWPIATLFVLDARCLENEIILAWLEQPSRAVSTIATSTVLRECGELGLEQGDVGFLPTKREFNGHDLHALQSQCASAPPLSLLPAACHSQCAQSTASACGCTLFNPISANVIREGIDAVNGGPLQLNSLRSRKSLWQAIEASASFALSAPDPGW